MIKFLVIVFGLGALIAWPVSIAVEKWLWDYNPRRKNNGR